MALPSRPPRGEIPGWTKAISRRRDRLQSSILTWALSVPLVLAAIRLLAASPRSVPLLWSLLLSALFALAAWRLRAATPFAALLGGIICLLLSGTTAQTSSRHLPGALASILPLLTLFLLTFAATRFRRKAKESSGLAEARSGRRAAQILANLAAAGLCAALGFYPGALAALAEATADTVSSEIGQALGGPTRLLTSLRAVPPGTDGGISLPGTLTGVAASALVVVTACVGLISGHVALAVFLSGVAGLLFDSFLGATLERRGLIGNDLVNFTSTAFAVAVAWLTLRS